MSDLLSDILILFLIFAGTCGACGAVVVAAARTVRNSPPKRVIPYSPPPPTPEEAETETVMLAPIVRSLGTPYRSTPEVSHELTHEEACRVTEACEKAMHEAHAEAREAVKRWKLAVAAKEQAWRVRIEAHNQETRKARSEDMDRLRDNECEEADLRAFTEAIAEEEAAAADAPAQTARGAA